MSRELRVNRFTTTAQGLVPAPGSAVGAVLKDDGTWGGVTYLRTSIEIALGITPTNYAFPQAYAARYGAVGDGINPDDAAIQTAISVAQEQGIPVYLMPGAKHYLANGLVFKQGKSAIDTLSYTPWLIGGYATLFPAAGKTAVTIVPRCLLIDIATGRSVAPIYISDVVVDGGIAGVSGCNALLIGAAGLEWDSFSWSVIRNFTVQNLVAPGGTVAVMLVEGRHCVFENMALRKGATCFIQALTTNSFVGDFIFNSCEFTGTAAQSPITITAGAGATNSQARGIKFVACDIYGGGTFIHATGSGQVGDIWFTQGCQFDIAAGTDVFVTLYADSATSQLFDVHFLDGYYTKGTQAFYIHKVAGAMMVQIEIGGGVVSEMALTGVLGAAAIYCLGANGVSVHDVQFDATTGNGTTSTYINMDGCTNFAVNNNLATDAITMTYGVSYGNAVTKFSVLGNMMNCTTIINDYHTGTPVSQVANNLAV